MVGPSPPSDDPGLSESADKRALRSRYRAARRAHVAALPQAIRALLFLRPPVPVVQRVPEGATVGLYHPLADEAPALSYARWLHENGRKVALPWFADRAAPMAFRTWSDPFAEDTLARGPYGMQPASDAAEVVPTVLFVPLLAFTAQGARLGQGGGHYDRWLAAHPDTLAIGMAWDVQLAESLPHEAHDRPLAMVVTPTRLYEGHADA